MFLGVHTSVHGTSTWDWCCRALANPGLSNLGLYKPPRHQQWADGSRCAHHGANEVITPLTAFRASMGNIRRHSRLGYISVVPTMFPDGKRTRKSMHRAGLTKGLKSNMHKNYYLLKCLFLGSSGTLCISNQVPRCCCPSEGHLRTIG